ncbi:MAG: PDZ domain-containing protein [Planctomycetaceae bacterium]|nr:PDZ domain-containing protein [Planctomycetaceae bacterium]
MRIPWRSLFWLGLVGGGVYVAWSPDPDTSPASGGAVIRPQWSEADLSALIADLNSDDDAVHEHAFRELVASGAAAVPPLEATALEVRRFHRRRVMDVLEQLLLASELEAADAAESALERMAYRAERHIANDASRVLFDNASFIHARALAQVIQGRGKELEPDTPGIPPELRADFLRITSESEGKGLVIAGDWTGGETGLRLIQRVHPRDTLLVFVTPDAPVTTEEIGRMTRGRKTMRVRHPQSTCLGLILDESLIRGRLVAVIVFPRGPAARAGVTIGDVLVALNGEDISSREELDRELLAFRPGETVSLQMERRSAPHTFSVQLGSDYRTLRCNCVERVGPPPGNSEPSVLSPVSESTGQ